MFGITFGEPWKKRNNYLKLFKGYTIPRMNTTPENVPDELLIQVKVVHAQLLIKTNTPDIVQEILDIYMVGLEI